MNTDVTREEIDTVNDLVQTLSELLDGHAPHLALAALNLATLAVVLTDTDGQADQAEALLRGQLDDALQVLADNAQGIALQRQGGAN